MRFRPSIASFIMVLVFCCLSLNLNLSIANEGNPASIIPDKEAMEILNNAVALNWAPPKTEEQFRLVRKQIDRIASLIRQDPEKMIPQIIYRIAQFAKDRSDNDAGEKGLFLAAIVGRSGLSQEKMIEILIQYSDADDPHVKETVYWFLKDFERNYVRVHFPVLSRNIRDDRSRSFEIYRFLIQGKAAKDEKPDLKILKYMYESSPYNALILLNSTYEKDQMERIQTAERADSIQEYFTEEPFFRRRMRTNEQFVKDREVQKAHVNNTLQKFANGPWWQKQYAEAIMKKHGIPGVPTQETVPPEDTNPAK